MGVALDLLLVVGGDGPAENVILQRAVLVQLVYAHGEELQQRTRVVLVPLRRILGWIANDQNRTPSPPRIMLHAVI